MLAMAGNTFTVSLYDIGAVRFKVFTLLRTAHATYSLTRVRSENASGVSL